MIPRSSAAGSIVDSGALPYLLSLPVRGAPARGWPLLVFLHGYDEGAPMPIRRAMALHGPLAASAAPVAAAEFAIAAPQMPERGDRWSQHAGAVREIVERLLGRHLVDPERLFLTGFSFGANGVFDLALALPGTWAALWAVDPTRVPGADPGRPAWLSSGQVSRHAGHTFIARLGLEAYDDTARGDRVYEDNGVDHVGTARLAYGDERIYRWLLTKQLSGATAPA